MMYMKIHGSGERLGYRAVVAVCDEGILGKTLKDKKREFKVSESFYKGDKKTEEEVVAILVNASNVNLIGKEAVAAGMKAGIVSKENILVIAGVPHAQAVSF